MSPAVGSLPPTVCRAEAALRAFVDRSTLFAFDLDGTLAPIVAEPSRARVPGEVRARLCQLERLAPVVVVTGRRCADARLLLGPRPRRLVGNHGAEGLPGESAAERRYARLAARWSAQLQDLLPAAGSRGIFVEAKGASVSLHYRNAADRPGARRAILGAVSRLDPPPRRVRGKYVENLLPRDAPDKGEALAAVMRAVGCCRAVYVGDDETDEAVFRRGPSIFGIRVGSRRGSAGRVLLRRQRSVGALLSLLLSLARRLVPDGGRAAAAPGRIRPGSER